MLNWYKVIVGSRRYTVEFSERVQAASTEEACRKALKMHKGMRYAIARKEG